MGATWVQWTTISWSKTRTIFFSAVVTDSTLRNVHPVFSSYLKRWINNVTHSTVLPNVYIRLEGIGPVMIPMPVPIDSAYKDGVIRCDFTDVDPELLADYGWFKELVIWKQVPALKDQGTL